MEKEKLQLQEQIYAHLKNHPATKTWIDGCEKNYTTDVPMMVATAMVDFNRSEESDVNCFDNLNKETPTDICPNCKTPLRTTALNNKYCKNCDYLNGKTTNEQPIKFHVSPDENMLSIYNRLLSLKGKLVLFKKSIGRSLTIYDVSVPQFTREWPHSRKDKGWTFYVEYGEEDLNGNRCTKKISSTLRKKSDDWQKDFSDVIEYIQDPHPFIHFTKESVDKLNKALEEPAKWVTDNFEVKKREEE